MKKLVILCLTLLSLNLSALAQGCSGLNPECEELKYKAMQYEKYQSNKTTYQLNPSVGSLLKATPTETNNYRYNYQTPIYNNSSQPSGYKYRY